MYLPCYRKRGRISVVNARSRNLDNYTRHDMYGKMFDLSIEGGKIVYKRGYDERIFNDEI